MLRSLAIAVLFLLLLSGLTARAADPIGQIISYQGHLSLADGRPVGDGMRQITFRIYANADYASPVFTETMPVATFGGRFSVLLHVGALALDPVKVYEMGTILGADEIRMPIAAVPRALTARTVTGATSANVAGAVVQRDALGGIGAASILFGDGTAQTTAYDPARVVRISPSPTQTITGTQGIRLRFSGTTGAETFLQFGLLDTGVVGDGTSRTMLDQFLLRADGGLLSKGRLGVGIIPTSGAGERLMWYPFKSSFRVGGVSGQQWDDINNGFYSVATGCDTQANGLYAVAMGYQSDASNTAGIALGYRATASGQMATAFGMNTTASGLASSAFGQYTTAGGEYSTAMGRHASTNGHRGSFVYGDTTGSSANLLNAAADNQFAVRAQSVWLGKTGAATATAGRFLETSTGAYLSNTGVWTNASSRALKTGFAPVDARSVLRRVVDMPITEWSYRANIGERHIGPMAQDFAKAFGLGLGEDAIATVDADGVALAAIQGLNEELEDRDARIAALEARLATLERLVAGEKP